MKKKNLIIGGVALALAAAGVFLLLRKRKPGGTSGTSGTSETGTSGTSGTSGSMSGMAPFQKYTVTTSSSNLNVRKQPNTSSEIIGSLPKSSTIFARPSGNVGWHEYSSDGINNSGFVSSQYITKA